MTDQELWDLYVGDDEYSFQLAEASLEDTAEWVEIVNETGTYETDLAPQEIARRLREYALEQTKDS